MPERPPVQAEMFEGMPQPEPVRVVPEARNSLARALTPEYQGIREEDYLDITDRMLDLAEPNLFKASLIGSDVQGDHDRQQFFVWYDSPETRSFVRLAVSPPEYLLMKGDIKTLGSRVVARTAAARGQADGFMAETNRAAAQRSGLHAVDGRVPQMRGYVDKALAEKFAIIDKFKEASATGRRTGLARFGDEAKMRQAFAFLQTYVFDEMFDVIGNQRGWNLDQAKLAQRTVTRRLYLERQRNQHVQYFRNLLGVAETWNGYKRAVVSQRIYQADRYHRAHMADEVSA